MKQPPLVLNSLLHKNNPDMAVQAIKAVQKGIDVLMIHNGDIWRVIKVVPQGEK
jgi:predicted type IV restriction endonuclease